MSYSAATSASADNTMLGRADIRTLGLSSLGGMLEYFDFIVYVFFAKVIGAVFFPPHMSEWLRELQTFGIFAVGYLVRPLGGVLFGHFADRLGRKRMFTISVLLMAVPTLLVACLPGYAAIGIAAPLLLLLLRMLQGLAVGGELTGAWVFVAEHVPRRHYGLGLGVTMGGVNSGVLLGSIVAAAIHAWYPPGEIQEFAWRLPFILGGVLGLASVYLRRLLEETPVFRALQERQHAERELPLRRVLRGYRAELLYIGLQTLVLSAAVGVVLLLAPLYLPKMYGVTPADALRANVAATLAATFGCVLAGWASDRVGARLVMIIGWGGLLVSGTWLLACGVPGEALMPRYALAGLFVGTLAVVPIVSVRLFPAEIRASGVAFGYNIFYAVFGGLTPILVSYLLREDARAPAHYLGIVCMLGVLAALLPQSRSDAERREGAYRV